VVPSPVSTEQLAAGRLAERHSSGTVWRTTFLLAPLFTLLIAMSTPGWQPRPASEQPYGSSPADSSPRL
jgi:hypothetical protein